MPSTPTSNSPPKKKDGTCPKDEKMDLFEFIKVVESLKTEELEIERRAAEQEEEAALAELAAQSSANSVPAKDGNKLTSGLRFLSKKSKDVVASDLPGEIQNERKFSAEHSKVKPSLRMKAFKNRQDTFHSLASCCDQVPPEPHTNVNTSSASLTEDLLRMPFVEGLSTQVNQLKQKIYSKVHSEPLLPNNSSPNNSNNNNGSNSNEEPKKRRVLHTIVQPDGSVIGFCTEEEGVAQANDDQEEEQQTEEISDSEKPSTSQEKPGPSKDKAGSSKESKK